MSNRSTLLAGHPPMHLSILCSLLSFCFFLAGQPVLMFAKGDPPSSRTITTQYPHPRPQQPADGANRFSFRDQAKQLEIFYAKQRIATYLKDHPQLSRRALVNVQSLQGTQVTRNFPARAPQDIDPGHKGEQGIIHPYMHPGIWVSYGDVAGHDYWRLQTRVKFDAWVKPPAGNRDMGQFSARNFLMGKDGKEIICHELSHYRFKVIPAGLLLLIEVEYKSDRNDFYFGDQEESGLAIRVASPIRVAGGNGTIVNHRGEKNGKAIWGKPARWFDYSGTIGNRHVGIMVAANPENFRPSWLHARDYGLVVTNPFPKQPRERRQPYIKTPVKKDETLRLSWAILIHDDPQEQPLDREALYKSMLKQLGP